jgi:hypothetical protein
MISRQQEAGDGLFRQRQAVRDMMHNNAAALHSDVLEVYISLRCDIAWCKPHRKALAIWERKVQVMRGEWTKRSVPQLYSASLEDLL